MTTYPTADLLIRIKNGYLSGREQVSIPYSKLKEEIVKKLVQTHYIKMYEVKGDGVKKEILVNLIYKKGKPVFNDLKIYSKPGRRWYVNVKDIKPVLSGLGVAIISTSQGLLTNNEARKAGVGGELLFTIW